MSGLEVASYTVPTEQLETDGTAAWDSTTIVVVEVTAGNEHGLGYTYGHQASEHVVRDKLAASVVGRDALDPGPVWEEMVRSVRNIGWSGVAAHAISAVDVALWDLKARLLGVPLVTAIGAMHGAVPIYGSGGFCSYDLETLARQLSGWVEEGIPRVKMKVGRRPDKDGERLAVARRAIGDGVQLLVDANGALQRKQALRWAQVYADAGVVWFEEPVSSDDLDGLRLLRDAGPPGLDIAAGEYGYTPAYFEHMLAAGAVDCLQADVTRCGGITGFRIVAGLCDSHGLDLSAHCAPQLSAHAATQAWHLRHLEYFHDHVRIEHLLFDGVLEPVGGCLVPDRSRPGLGLELKRRDAERYRV